METKINELIFVQTIDAGGINAGISKLEDIKIVTTNDITEEQFDRMVISLRDKLFAKRETVKDIVNRTVKYTNKTCTCKNNDCKLKRVGQHYGLYCATCGKWIKWVSTKEVKTM